MSEHQKKLNMAEWQKERNALRAQLAERDAEIGRLLKSNKELESREDALLAYVAAKDPLGRLLRALGLVGEICATLSIEKNRRHLVGCDELQALVAEWSKQRAALSPVVEEPLGGDFEHSEKEK